MNLSSLKKRPFGAVLVMALTCGFLSIGQAQVQSAPNGPGLMATWSRPDKTAYATTLNRPLWFTLTGGTLTEVAYPHVDRVQTRDTYLVIRGSKVTVDERQLKAEVVRLPGSLAFQVHMTGPGVNILKRVYVDPDQDNIIMDYSIAFSGSETHELVLVHNPLAQSTSGGDEGFIRYDTGNPILYAYQKDIRGDEPQGLMPNAYQAVGWTLPESIGSVGFFGINSPVEAIQNGQSLPPFNIASYGNIALAMAHRSNQRQLNFRVVLAFTPEASVAKLTEQLQAALGKDQTKLLKEQQQEWGQYLRGLSYDRKDSLSESSILLLKAAEDKINRGALIAAPANPSIPWFAEAPEHNYENSRKRVGDSNAGYRRVWPRDLYHKAIAFLSVGDYATALSIAQFYRRTQLRDFRVGSWAQNMFADGTPSWNAYQLDQTGLPIVLVYRLAKLNLLKYSDYRPMVLAAAERILQSGPMTEQERWEENGGLSLNSLAAGVEGLYAAYSLETNFGDAKGAVRYKQAADAWRSNIKAWTLIPSGAFGNNYFARIEVGDGQRFRPDLQSEIFIHNKAEGMKNRFREDEILDGGFLQWIIAGLVDPQDTDFTRTLRIYDAKVRKPSPYGLGYLRYNEDAYGENHRGGLWPILSAERALVAIERHEPYMEHLQLIQKISTPSGMIGEQDTLAVRPLLWSHASYLILKRSIVLGRSFYINFN